MADNGRIAFSGEAGEVAASVRDEWDGGAVIDLHLTARAPLSDWTIILVLEGQITNLWNAAILAREGPRTVLGPAPYNALIPAGGTVEIGFQVEGRPGVDVVTLDTVLAADAAQDSISEAVPLPPDEPSANALATPRTAEDTPRSEPVPGRPEASEGAAEEGSETAAGGTVGLKVTAPRVSEGGPPSPFASAAALQAPLSTRGGSIVDEAASPVQIHGLSWFGLETEIFTPHGLWARNWREMMDDARALGFNALRIPFSGELATGGGPVEGIDYGLNPDLEGLDGLQILDAVVDYAATIGMGIILDYHRGAAGSGPNDNGLWYGNGRSEADVAGEWQAIAARYANAPAVIGVDLINEPFMATWGDGSRTDWAAAAERLTAHVHAQAPHWLILVQGVAVHAGEPYWWGGNLMGARDRPIALEHQDKLVYSPHDYPASVHAQPWFFDGSDLTTLFRENWGYLAEEGMAPVIVGEWGSRLEDPLDAIWAEAMVAYMQTHGISWIWWSLNPNSGDTGGLFADDWQTVRPEVLSLMEPFLGAARLADPSATAMTARFTIERTGPADNQLDLTFATVDGSARAGLDYLATAGTLAIGAGETTTTIDVPIFSDDAREGSENFYLVLTGPGDVSARVRAEIVDPDDQRTFVPPSGGGWRDPLPIRHGANEAGDTAATTDHGGIGKAQHVSRPLGAMAERDDLPAPELQRSATVASDAAIDAARDAVSGQHVGAVGPSRFAFAPATDTGAAAPLDGAAGEGCSPPPDAQNASLTVDLPADLSDLAALCG